MDWALIAIVTIVLATHWWRLEARARGLEETLRKSGEKVIELTFENGQLDREVELLDRAVRERDEEHDYLATVIQAFSEAGGDCAGIANHLGAIRDKISSLLTVKSIEAETQRKAKLKDQATFENATRAAREGVGMWKSLEQRKGRRE